MLLVLADNKAKTENQAMSKRAKEGTCLAVLVEMAIPLCQEAERLCPRRGPGRKPGIPDWVMAVLIMVAVAKRKKTKSAQYCFLKEHRELLTELLPSQRFPARSTYYERYRRIWRLYEMAIRVQGERAVRSGCADAQCVAVDKSLVAARGPVWHQHQGQRRRRRRGVDPEAGWAYNEHDDWVYGYSYEVVISAGKTGVIWPLLASADRASRNENRTFREKIPFLPKRTRYVLADRGYDADDHCETIEWEANGQRSGRRFLCPTRRSARGAPRQTWKRSRERKVRSAHRAQRKAFLQTPRGRRLYARRSMTVEPFNSWLKALFELEERTWHYGLANNRTQFLAAILIYQLLLRLNRLWGNNNGRVKWILDAL